MHKTYQTVELENGRWSVFCVETGDEISVCDDKATAVRVVTGLNHRRFPLAQPVEID